MTGPVVGSAIDAGYNFRMDAVREMTDGRIASREYDMADSDAMENCVVCDGFDRRDQNGRPAFRSGSGTHCS